MESQSGEYICKGIIIFSYKHFLWYVPLHIEFSCFRKGIGNHGILIDKNDSKISLVFPALTDIYLCYLLIRKSPVHDNHEIILHTIAIELIHDSRGKSLEFTCIISCITFKTASVRIRIKNYIVTSFNSRYEFAFACSRCSCQENGRNHFGVYSKPFFLFLYIFFEVTGHSFRAIFRIWKLFIHTVDL